MKKETLDEIVTVLIDHLKAAPNGYDVTTYLLLENAAMTRAALILPIFSRSTLRCLRRQKKPA